MRQNEGAIVEDVAAMVYAVATGRFVNGAIINVDGGLLKDRLPVPGPRVYMRRV